MSIMQRKREIMSYVPIQVKYIASLSSAGQWSAVQSSPVKCFAEKWSADCDAVQCSAVQWANRQYLAQMVGVGGMGFVVGKK